MENSIEKGNISEEPLLGGAQPPRPPQAPPLKGGFRTIPFILVNEALEKVANYGLLPNMILYLMAEYGMGAAKAANVIFLWSAATNFAPIVGAFLADSYVGRFRMLAFGSVITLLGMILLWTTTMFPRARPACDKYRNSCENPTIPQLFLLYSSFALMSIGAGGLRSSCLAFAADQLTNTSDHQTSDPSDQTSKTPRIATSAPDKTSKTPLIATSAIDPTNATHHQTSTTHRIATSALDRLFKWYYTSIMVAAFLAQTCIVYIQTNIGWRVGFGVPVVLMFLSTVSFFLATPFYVTVKPKASLVSGFVRVIVAAFRNRQVPLSLDHQISYHHKKGSSLSVPTQKLRFLNKACVIRNQEEDLTLTGDASNPWTLCTVDQVEDLKSLINVLPIWSTGIILSVTCAQATFVVLQAKSMNRDTIIPGIQIPPGSFGVFMVISFSIFIPLYDRVVIPGISRIRGKPVRLGLMDRMGTGLLISVFSMASLAITEFFRRKTAIKEIKSGFMQKPRVSARKLGFMQNPQEIAIKLGIMQKPESETAMSAMWLLPYFVLDGIAEALNAIAQNEFYYTELPRTMSSIATTLYGVGMSAASLVSSLVISIVDDVTRSFGDVSWVSSDIDAGHLDYYYWLIAGLCLVNFVYFVGCSRAYGECRGEKRDDCFGEDDDD